MAAAHTGHNTKSRKTTKKERKAVGEANAPAVVPEYKAKNDKALAGDISVELAMVERWHELAAIEGTPLVFTPMQRVVLKTLADALHYSVAEWGAMGEEYQRRAMLAAKAYAAQATKPVDRRECFKCHKELTPSVPAFRWAVDGNLYCGSCYNTLPPSVKPIEVKPIEVKPVKVEPLIKELHAMKALLPQAPQDKKEVEPLALKAKVDLKRLTPAEIRCRNLATSQAHWDKMYLAQLEWHRQCRGGLVGAAEKERRMRHPDPEPSAPASLPLAA
jgi:hypothetical protein